MSTILPVLHWGSLFSRFSWSPLLTLPYTYYSGYWKGVVDYFIVNFQYNYTMLTNSIIRCVWPVQIYKSGYVSYHGYLLRDHIGRRRKSSSWFGTLRRRLWRRIPTSDTIHSQGSCTNSEKWRGDIIHDFNQKISTYMKVIIVRFYIYIYI